MRQRTTGGSIHGDRDSTTVAISRSAFDEFERQMKQCSTDFNEWISAKDEFPHNDNGTHTHTSRQQQSLRHWMLLSANQRPVSPHPSQDQASSSESEFVSIPIHDESDQDYCDSQRTKRPNKRVSWGPLVEIRDYPVVAGTHLPAHKFPLTLDWDYHHHPSTTTTTRSVATATHRRCSRTQALDAYSRERQASYRGPPRLSLADRRRKLLGDVPETLLAEFAVIDSSLEDLMKDLDECLHLTHEVATLPDFAIVSIVLPPLLSLSTATTNTACGNSRSSSRRRLRDDPESMVRWERITC